MSKHLGPLFKVDNTGVKWYRKVSNAGDRISAHTLVELCYDSTYNLVNNPTMSGDYNLVRPLSAGATSFAASSIVFGVADETIPAYCNTTHTGLPTGWVQFKGPAMISSQLLVTQGHPVIPCSSSGVSGVGRIMKAATSEDAMSAGIGICLSTAGAAESWGSDGCAWTWVYLNLP
jgi:hypothetical protein